MDDDISEASAIDEKIDTKYPNVAAKASIKAFPPAALAQVDEDAQLKAKENEKMLAEKQ